MLYCLVHFHTNIESRELLSHPEPVEKYFNDLKHLMPGTTLDLCVRLEYRLT